MHLARALRRGQRPLLSLARIRTLTEERDFDYWHVQIFCLRHCFQTESEIYLADLITPHPTWLRWPQCKANHSTASYVKVMNLWSFTCVPYCLSLDNLEELGCTSFRHICTCSQSIWLNISTISSNMAQRSVSLS
jgi:hypothetical protein